MAGVWGGEAGCKHEWGEWQEKHDVREEAQHGKSKTTDRYYGDESRRFDGNHQKHTAGQYCLHCGAWYGELGLEPTPEQYVENMVAVFREVRRVLRDDGTVWLNLGDSYYANRQSTGQMWDDGNLSRSYMARAGGKDHPSLKPKDLVGIPWRVAFALQADGWWLRSDIIWSKPNPMPESVTDRPTKAHEYLFLLSKSSRYFYDADNIREGVTGNAHPQGKGYGVKVVEFGQGIKQNHSFAAAIHNATKDDLPTSRNRRTVWQIATMPYSASVETSHLGLVPVHEVSGGMIHIILPDCPHHGDLFVPLAREFYGGHEADYWNRIERICNRLAQVPFRDCAPTDQQRELGYLEQSLGYFPRVYSPTAIDHSNQTHRMALALDSTPPYIPFFEKILRIDDKRELLSSFVQHLCIYGNSILIDGCDAHLSRSIPHRIVDKSFLESSFLASDIPSCTCLYYRHYTRKPDHFATYPPKLVEPAIKAGTSERGCCPECGAPWERVVERHSSIPLERIDYQQVGAADRRVKLSGPRLAEWKKGHPDKFLGWRPTCDHEHEPIPSTVFDPFAGSGTTLLVARQLGRNGVGVDLSREYLHLARERLSLDALEAWETGKRDSGKGDISELPLFGCDGWQS